MKYQKKKDLLLLVTKLIEKILVLLKNTIYELFLKSENTKFVKQAKIITQ